MRRYKVTYFIGQAFKGLWRNGMMTLASVTVLLSCLIVMGCFSMLVMNINMNLTTLGDLNEIVAFVYSDVTYESGKTISLAPAPQSEGKTFLGWSTDPDDVAPPYAAGSSYTVASDDAICGVVTLYAIWSDKAQAADSSMAVRYHAGGVAVTSEIPTDSASYEVGGTVTLPAALTAKNSSLEFLGWSLNPTAATPDFEPGATYTIAKEAVRGGYLTFYAVWSKAPTFTTYAVVYDANRASVAEMPTDASVRLNAVRTQLYRLDNISPGGIRFVSKEEALKEEMENYKDYPGLLASYESMIAEMGNPLPDSFIITYEDNNKVAALQLQLEHIEHVDNVRCRADIAANIESLKSGIVLVFSWFMVILFVVSVFVIINTVKLAVVHRSKEITIMRYIGATKWFIALPFELEGIFIGLLSGGLAFSIQWYAYGYVQKMILSGVPMIDMIPFSEIRVLILVGCLAVGVITGLIGSMVAIQKYLKA